MSLFTPTLQSVVNNGLSMLQEAVASGKTQNNPVSKTHCLHAWISQVLKQQKYDPCVTKTLLQWQQHARSTGTKSGLVRQFERLQHAYQSVEGKRFQQAEIQSLLDDFAKQDWLLTTEYPVLRKVSHSTGGQASLVVCCEQWKAAFDASGHWVKPLSFFVRGDHDALLQTAAKHGLLLFKVTDYKSLVKFHGEYRLFPDNQGDRLPELTLFDA